jgi:tetratricopeptide (TPR) repeat protein
MSAHTHSHTRTRARIPEANSPSTNLKYSRTCLRTWQCKEERELAKVLYDDFNRLPAADFSHLGLQGAKERSVEDMRRDGNTMLKEGRVQQAIDCYTRAIEMAKEGETDSLSLLNRALARLKLDPPDNTGVVQDCDSAIRGGDEENPKAYYRKALGLEGMGNFEAALAAATKAKKLAHGDKGVADVCERIEKKLKDERERARKEKAEKEKEERKQKEKDKAAEKLRKAHDVDELD